MDASIVGGSDEGYEFVCQPCERDNQYEEGIGYCVDCTEYMCSTCLTCHKKSRVSRDHNLLDKSTIKQGGISPSLPSRPQKPTESMQPPPIPSKPTKLAMLSKTANPQDPIKRKCKKHTDEFTKLYCNKHNELVCTVCLIKDHTDCSKDVTYIPEVSGDITKSSEFRDMFMDLKNIRALIGFEHGRMIYNDKRIDEIHDEILDDAIKFKEEMIKAIEGMFKMSEQDLKALRDEQKASLISWLKSYNTIVQEVETAIQNLETHMSNGNFNQLFIEMKLIQRDIAKLKKESQRLSDKNIVTEYTFVQNNNLEGMQKRAKGVGKIHKSFIDVEFMHELNIKSDIDKNECRVEGLVVLPDGNVAVADNANKSVKIIDVNQQKIKTQKVLESEPFDITLVDIDQLVVTLPNVNKILFLQLGKTDLTIKQSISTTHTCVGIDFHDQKIFTACQDNPGCCLVLDMSGKILKKISDGYLGNSLFTKPRCLALSIDKNALYVTEEDEGCVKLVNLNSEQIAEFQLTGIKKPIGVVSDVNGNVYISLGGENAIYRLSPTCGEPQMIFGELNAPWALALDRHRRLLYVGSAGALPQERNTLRVISLAFWINLDDLH